MTIAPAELEAERAERFKALAAAQLPRLYAVARRLVGEEAEDAVQDALLKAFRKIDQLREEASGPAWLMAILTNVCRDRGRRAARNPAEIDIDEVDHFSLYRTIADEDPFPYSDALHLEFLQEFGADDVRAVLDAIPDMYRIPLVLVHMEGFSTKEVARMLQAPLGTVLARLHRGRKLFEKKLWAYSIQHGLVKEGVR